MIIDLAPFVDAIQFDDNPQILPEFSVFQSFRGNIFSVVSKKRKDDYTNATLYVCANTQQYINNMIKVLKKSGAVFLWEPFLFRIISLSFDVRTGSGGSSNGEFRYLATIRAKIRPEA